jgi:hypothetical protein
MDGVELLTVIHAATRILAVRVMTMVCLVMVFGLFCWAMYLGTPVAVATAAGFGLIIFLPVLATDRRTGGGNGTES